MSVSYNFDINLINSSTPIKQVGQSNQTSMIEDLVNEAELSDKMNLSGASRMVEPMKLIVDRLDNMKKIIEQKDVTLFSKELKGVKKSFEDFFNVVEELIIKCGEKRPQEDNFGNSSGDFLQQIYRLKLELEKQEKINSSLDEENQLLIAEKLKLIGKDEDLLDRKRLMKDNLHNVLKERDVLYASIREIEEDKNRLIAENKQLRQGKDELDEYYKYISRPTKTRSIAMQTEDISKSGEITQLDDRYPRWVEQQELIEKIDVMKKQIEELLSERIILWDHVERLKTGSKRLEDGWSTKISHFCSGENLYNEFAAIEKREKLDNSTQNEMEPEVGPEAMVPTKNVDLVSVKQGYSKRASNLSQVPEKSSAVKSQFLAVSAHGRKQIICASASLILSGAFAVGASLTMSHLGISISLALTALTFLTLGCYCSYKASTTLRNIELDQTFKIANHEAVFMVPSL
ncbi:hypothetical protein [Wolbachia endosymbiont (group A) of Gastracanthus pulcherrimus]|uniref:TomO hydrophobic C-terminal domain-containing protein n=1 Tax=Wolbachia endosymbiont (group A) of Gastracanthus pulcherrimus TaxID=3066200 RepID=UPI0033417B45